MRKHLPGEDLYVFFDVPRFGYRKTHDDLEGLFAVCLGFGYSKWSESFEVATNAVLLFDGEAHSNKSLQQLDGVDAGDVTLTLLCPIDAADADAIWRTLFRADWLEGSGDDTALLTASELH